MSGSNLNRGLQLSPKSKSFSHFIVNGKKCFDLFRTIMNNLMYLDLQSRICGGALA